MPAVHPSVRPAQPERPLVVTADPDVLDDLLRLAATAGTDQPACRRSIISIRPCRVVLAFSWTSIRGSGL